MGRHERRGTIASTGTDLFKREHTERSLSSRVEPYRGGAFNPKDTRLIQNCVLRLSARRSRRSVGCDRHSPTVLPLLTNLPLNISLQF